MLTVVSLGAGVQSTTMVLMAARGELTPMPDCAIFADTQSEPADVYRHLEWLRSGVLPFTVHLVTAGNLSEQIGSARPAGKFLKVDIPAYVRAPDGTTALINRSCTRDFKIVPIRRKLRQLLGITGKRSPKAPIVEQWIGISLDEASRMKPSREPWIQIRWPLIERRMTRTDCLAWMERNGYQRPPKSACTFCPYHDDRQWRGLSPEDFAAAVAVDERLRSRPSSAYRSKGTLYLHRSCKPLAEVDFSTLEDHGQMNFFENECEGMCGN